MNKPRVRVLIASKGIMNTTDNYWWIKCHFGDLPLATVNPSGQVNYFIYL